MLNQRGENLDSCLPCLFKIKDEKSKIKIWDAFPLWILIFWSGLLKIIMRKIDVFFYGLFMDQDLLREKGLLPENVEVASLDGFELRIGKRAALVPKASCQVYGIVMSLSLDEVERLYSDPGVSAYKPQTVLAELQSGSKIPAFCYNLPDPPSQNESNPEYAAKLIAVAKKVGLPQQYIENLKRSFML
jgi:hypothetical protein